MHFFCAVVIPASIDDDDLEQHVALALEPYNEERRVEEVHDEEYNETYWHNPDGHWDWYQIGGRWTGVWSDYDPNTDPANIEPCRLCHGTGHRSDSVAQEFRAQNPGYSCNGCDGKGQAIKWPTQWGMHPGDITTVSAFLDDKLSRPLALCIPEQGWFAKEWWNRAEREWQEIEDDQWEQLLQERLEPLRKAKMVVVDCHT